jgi:NADH dehydrogenase/putative oxidoreductase
VAKLIAARLRGRPDPKPFCYRHSGSLATIGRRVAVADFGAVRLQGALAWWIWGAVHIIFLAGGRNRMAVVVNWAWAYLTGRRGSRIIVERDAKRP